MARPFARSNHSSSGAETNNHTSAEIDAAFGVAAASPPQEPSYFEQKYEHNLWGLIKENLPCFAYQNNKFHLVNNDDGAILQTFDSTSPTILLDFMLKHGIPNAETLGEDVREELTEEIVMTYVPKEDLKNAQRTLNGFVREDLRILDDSEILDVLKDFGFRFGIDDERSIRGFYGKDMCDYSIYRPNELVQSDDSLTSLEEVRAFVRGNENLSYSNNNESGVGHRAKRIRNSGNNSLKQRKRMLSLRIWAATSKEPLPDFDWSKFGGTGEPAKIAVKPQKKHPTQLKTSKSGHAAASATATAPTKCPEGDDDEEDGKPRAHTKMRERNAAGKPAAVSARPTRRWKAPPMPRMSTLAAGTARHVSLSGKRSSNDTASAAELKRVKKEVTSTTNENFENLSNEDIEARNAPLRARVDSLQEYLNLKRKEQQLLRELEEMDQE